jgi:hypothetical protein
VDGEPEHLVLWTQVITGMELDNQGAVRILDAGAWQERWQRMMRLGGPPRP